MLTFFSLAFSRHSSVGRSLHWRVFSVLLCKLVKNLDNVWRAFKVYVLPYLI